MEKSKAKDRIDISVIVPFYNVEEYLAECLDSLLRQGDVSLEVIMVDDGSTDKSGEIADDYAKRNSGFICYHVQNGGPGRARNIGTKYAKGDYIVFVDYYYRLGYIVGSLYALFHLSVGIIGLLMLFKREYYKPQYAFVVMVIGMFSVYSVLEISMLPFIRVIPCLFFITIAPALTYHRKN